MRMSWPIVIGIVMVAMNGLVFVQEWHAYRMAPPGSGARFPAWPLVALLAAAGYLLWAGIAFDRARRRDR